MDHYNDFFEGVTSISLSFRRLSCLLCAQIVSPYNDNLNKIYIYLVLILRYPEPAKTFKTQFFFNLSG